MGTPIKIHDSRRRLILRNRDKDKDTNISYIASALGFLASKLCYFYYLNLRISSYFPWPKVTIYEQTNWVVLVSIVYSNT